jgi:uncharacterized membrane protein
MKYAITSTAIVERWTEMAAAAALAAAWIVCFAGYQNVPETVPSHFDAAGKPDAYGDKAIIFLLPIVATVVYVIMTLITGFRSKLISRSGGTSARNYDESKLILRLLKLMIILLLLYILVFTMKTAHGTASGLGKWFLPFTIVAMSIAVVMTLKKRFNLKKT